MDAKDKDESKDRRREETLAQRVGQALDQMNPSGVDECPDAGIIAAYSDHGLSLDETARWESHFATSRGAERFCACLRLRRTRRLPKTRWRDSGNSLQRHASLREPQPEVKVRRSLSQRHGIGVCVGSRPPSEQPLFWRYGLRCGRRGAQLRPFLRQSSLRRLPRKRRFRTRRQRTNPPPIFCVMTSRLQRVLPPVRKPLLLRSIQKTRLRLVVPPPQTIR